MSARPPFRPSAGHGPCPRCGAYRPVPRHRRQLGALGLVPREDPLPELSGWRRNGCGLCARQEEEPRLG